MAEQQIQLKAADEVLQGRYANAVQISHTKEEVVFDFLNLMPPQGQLVSRLIITPGHAKRFLSALTDNLGKYEKQFGPLMAEPTPKHDFGFTS